ncbi:MAG: hypothetical protein U1E05_03275 [Patescibacteria group bacterium]|nr:hypothetical protein [Patescibacteria group bacterium]
MTALKKEKLLNRLTKRQRQRREQRPLMVEIEAKPASRGLRAYMVEHHEDLLHTIELIVMDTYRRDLMDGIDDRAVYEGYRDSILGIESDNSPSGMVVFAIANARALRESLCPVDDALWKDALRVLMRSVKTHSEKQPGETSYLDFIGRYLP